MVIWALFACLFVVLTAGSPVREPNVYGYDVKHPGGSSRVRVSSGSEGNGNSYTDKDYSPDATYVNPHYVQAPYQHNRYGPYQGDYNQEPFHGRPPVYVERSKYPQPATYHQHLSPRDQYPSYEQPPYTSYPKRHVISQSPVNTGPLYEKSFGPAYSNPHFVQQTSVEDETHSYVPNKLEQVPFDPKPTYEQIPEKYSFGKTVPVPTKPIIVQQVASDDFPKSSGYPDGHLSQSPLDKGPYPPAGHVQSPIDQQVLVDEPKDLPIISQKTLVEKPSLSQVAVDIPSVKNAPVLEQSPIVQQSSLGDIPPSSLVQYMNDDEISQVPVVDKPPVVQQQESVDDADYTFGKQPSYVSKSGPIQESINPFHDDVFIGKSHGNPVIQATIDDHPSQAVYDSSVEPSFSDTDHHIPPYSFAEQPKYRFVPSGPPYERISHSTEIIHGPRYSQAVPPQKHIEHNFPVVQDSYVPQSVKLPPPPPPPVTKTVIPAQEYVDSDLLLTKNSPLSQSAILSPPPITKSVVQEEIPYAQEHVDAEILHTKNPPITKSVKLPPPPPPVTKSIVQAELPDQQEHVDEDVLLTKNPVPQSVKLPPPPPISQSVKLPPPPPAVKSVKLPPPPPVSQSVKLPPPPPVVQSVKLPPPPPVYQSVKLPPPPPVSYSIKRPPPPPVSYSVKRPPPPPASYSVKYPHPPPVSYSVKRPHPPPSYSVKRPFPPPVSYSVKRPLPPPVSYSVKRPPAYVPAYKPFALQKPVPHIKRPFYGPKSIGPSHVKLPPPQPHWTKPHNVEFIKKPPPPHFSVKRPYAQGPVLTNPHLKAPSYVKAPVTKTSPVSHRVKVPVVSNIHSVKHPKPSYGPPSIKTPPLAPYLSAPASIKGGASYSDSVKKPYPSIVEAHSDPEGGNPHLKYSSHDAPPKKYLPITDGAEQPYHTSDEGFDSHALPPPPPPDTHSPHFDEPEDKSPFDKYPPVSHAIRLPVSIPPGDKSSGVDVIESSPLDKYPPVSHAIRLPSVIPTTTSVPNLFAAVPLPDSEEALLDKNSPITELDVSAPKSEALSSPVSHSVRLHLPGHSSSRLISRHEVDANFDEPKQPFPAFPVESAFKQRDPVSEKVNADLSNSFGRGYGDSHRGPEENDSPKAQSVNDAKIEIDRINREIGGVSFGDRIPRRSRFS